MNKKLRVERVALTLAISLVIVEVAYYIALKYERDRQEIIENDIVLQEVIETEEELNTRETVVEVEEIKQEVFFTSYYIGDGSSTNRTGSGLTTSDFDINENGWYTYQEKVVVACATNEGLASNYGVLKNYNEPNSNITYYSYFDELTIEVNGVEYKAICLDTCGASMNWNYLESTDNGINRIDIFVSEKKYSVGKIRGFIQCKEY